MSQNQSRYAKLRPAGHVSRSPSAVLRGLVLALLIGLVPLVSYLVTIIQRPEIERVARADLETVAAMKAEQIERWFEERYSDGKVVMASEAFIRQVQALQRKGGDSLVGAVRSSLIATVDPVQYESTTLVDLFGNTLMTLGGSGRLAPETLALLPKALGTGRPVFSDILVDSDGSRHIDSIVPLTLLEDGWRAPVGFVVLRLLPEDFLFPFVQSWPTASASGEALLARREGDQVLFLNELRHRVGTAMALRVPLSENQVPAVAAVLEARVGFNRGYDYRGVEVYSAYRPITGTEWVLVAKIDRAEVLAPLSEQVYLITLVTLAAVLVIGVVLLVLWRVQDRTRRLEIRGQSDAILRRFYDMPFIGIAVRPVGSDKWIMVNDYLCQLFGYSREELSELRWQDVCHPDDLDVTRLAVARLESGETECAVIEKRFVRKDGSVVDAAVDLRAVATSRGVPEFVFASIQDISERKAAEQRIHRLTNTYAALSETNQAIVRSLDEAELFPQICRFAVDFGGMRMAWIGTLDPKTRLVHPVAHHGAGGEFLERVTVSADPESPYGQGVAGRAIHGRAPCWMQDYLHEPGVRPWLSFAEANGWRSAAALPLSRSGNVVGVLVLFSTEVNAFDDQIKNLLVEMSHDVSYALTQFANEAERARSEEELRLAAKVFEQSAEAVVIADAGCRVLKVNRAFALSTGYSEHEALGMDANFLLGIAGEDGGGNPKIADALNREGAWQGEVVRRRKDGSSFPEFLSISRVFDAQGRASHIVGIFSDISELKASQQNVQRLSQFDELTGLPNRRLLEDRVGQVINRVARNSERMSLVFIDLDRFKNVNDSLGHRVGDKLLVEVAARLKATLREDDTIARLGGDEFILVLPETGVRGSSRVAEKVMHALSEPYVIERHELIVTPSLGIAIYPDDGSNYEALSMCADAAMYEAKEAGRSTFRFFTREMQDHSDRVLYLENALRRATELGQLQLHFQPQISLESNRVIGVEALLRWQHPELGAVSPVEFIPVAEDSGLIQPIGEWVLRTALSQLKAWQQSGSDFFSPLIMAVNISAVQFLRGDLPGLVRRVLEELDMQPDCLELELTEGVALGNPEEAIKVMDELHALGVRLAIDDFGTGYSSLSYLTRFKAYKLKIDQSFVRDIERDPDDKAIVEAIISMAGSLGMKTIAEGVETAEQMAYLYHRDCDEAQGYFIARPMSAEAFENFVRDFRLLG